MKILDLNHDLHPWYTLLAQLTCPASHGQNLPRPMKFQYLNLIYVLPRHLNCRPKIYLSDPQRNYLYLNRWKDDRPTETQRTTSRTRWQLRTKTCTLLLLAISPSPNKRSATPTDDLATSAIASFATRVDSGVD